MNQINTHWILLLVSVSSLSACATQNDEALIGVWKVKKMSQAEQEVTFKELEEVQFFFDENGQYIYHGTLNYVEIGTYRRSGHFLHTIDTSRQQQSERSVRILALEPGLLRLRMKNGEHDQTLELIKIDSL